MTEATQSKKMNSKVFDELVFDLMKSLRDGETSPVVLLGAGASVEAGIPLMRELIKHYKCTTSKEFYRYVQTLSPRRRFRRLSEFLQSRDPSAVSPGYRALATLIADKYFDIILSTNLDTMLEDAIADTPLRRRDFLLLVNGVMRPDRLDPVFSSNRPRVRVIKLHGDLFHRFMAWTPTEMESFLAEIGPQLEQALYGRDLVVVGHSLADSPRIEQIAREMLDDGGELWYVNLTAPPQSIKSHESVHRLNARFEEFFPRLADALDPEWRAILPAGGPGIRSPRAGAEKESVPPELSVGGGGGVQSVWKGSVSPEGGQVVRTIDDLMAAVVGIARREGPPVCTGFVLADSGLIVSDGYEANTGFYKEGVSVIAQDGRRFKTRAICLVRSHPFGPLLLKTPKSLQVPAFRLNAELPEKNLGIRVGVAAGDGVGITSGAIKDPSEKTLDIAPIGPVDHLIEIACAVAPGSSGAPVVDSQFAVRGFIVAGVDDLRNPRSEMYPAHRWAGDITERARGLSQGRQPPRRTARPARRH